MWCSLSPCTLTIPGHWHRHLRTQGRFSMSFGASLLPSTLRSVCHSKTNSDMSKRAGAPCCSKQLLTCDRMSRALLHVKAARLGLQPGPCTLSAHTTRPFIYSIYHRGDLPSVFYSARRTAGTMAHAGGAELLVLSGREAPELKELTNLPTGIHLLDTGRPGQEFKGWSNEDWAKVEVLLKCGTGKDASTKQELQDIWPHLTNLKWIHSASAGVEKLLFPELIESKVLVTNAKGAYSHSLAEWALTACSWFAKDLPRLKRQQKDRNWEPYYVEELRGKVLGVVGYGDIGQETANLARAFKMKIIALRRRKELSQHDTDLNLKIYTPDQLNDLMSESDYVVTALPHTDKTEKLVNAAAINSMKRTGVFVNIGRGQTVDEEALVKALQEKRIRGAGLDVTYTEPLPKDSPLWDLENVLLSPHCADRTTTFQAEAIQQFTDLAQLYVQDKELYNVVDKKTGY